MMKRWCIAELSVDRTPIGVADRAAAWARRALLPDGRLLVEAEWDQQQLIEAERDPTVTVLPSLSAPAATSLHAALLSLLAIWGVALGPTDDVQQALRKLRAALGLGVEDFRVDKEF